MCSTPRSCAPAGSTGRSSCRSRYPRPRADSAGAHEEGPRGADVKAEIIARGTPGFSGADLANLVNEAALFAARKNKRLVDMDDFERPKDKIVMARSAARCHARGKSAGTPPITVGDTRWWRSSSPRPIGDQGHDHSARAGAGRHDELPEQDRIQHGQGSAALDDYRPVRGRIAEEEFMGQMTTGASDDLSAPPPCRTCDSVGHVGREGPMVYARNEGEVFLGRSITTHKNVPR